MIKYKMIGNKYILDREDGKNYINECAALSFHKAIIGITELKALEELSDNPTAGGFRLSRAINTYYIIYHLFCSMMLLDETYDIQIKKKKCNNGYYYIAVDDKKLNNDSELPEAWNECGDAEQDIATLITHYNIKQYCENKRNNPPIVNDEFMILFRNFIEIDYTQPNKAVKGLYEKVCYVRDRTIYRPSNVYGKSEIRYQTSLDVRKEIEELPKAKELFNIISSIYKEIELKFKKKSKKVYLFMYYLWNNFVYDDIDYISSLGYLKKDIEELKINVEEPSKSIEVNSYLCHYIELADKDRLLSDMDKYWNHLCPNFMSIYKEYHT